MDVPELIELIQTHLPEDLTEEQIAEIRAKLADSPELQEAMLAELSMEQSLATKYASPPENFEEVIAQLQRLAAGRGKNRCVICSIIMLAVIAAGVGGFLLIRSHLNQPSTPIVTVTPPEKPTTTPAPTTRPADTQATTAPTTRPGGAKPIDPKDPGNTLTGIPQTQPADIVTPPATFPMGWSDYALAGSGEESNWRAHLLKLLRREGGAGEPKFSRDRKYVELNGSYRLGTVPAPGRMLRFEFKSGRSCKLEFWNANSKVLISIEPSKRISMVSIARKDAKSTPTVVDSCDDHYRWQSYRCYGVDIRHQNGHMMVCRGEVPLLSVAMDKPPTEGKLECSSLALNLVEARVVGPLALPSRKADPNSIRKTNAAAFDWKLDPADKKPEEVELVIDKNGGKVSFVNKVDSIHAKASFTLAEVPAAGVELTVHVTEFHPSTGIHLRSSLGADSIRFDPHEDRYVLHTSDRKKKADAIARGQTVGKEFWIRMRVAGDFWGIWISPDAKRWWRRLSGQSTSNLENITFGLELPTARIKDKGPRRTTLGDVTVRRFEAFAKLADPKLVAKAAEAMSEDMLKAYSIAGMLPSIDKANDKNVSALEWSMACDTVLISRATHWNVRRDAMRNLLFDAITRGSGDDTDKILTAVNELSDIAWQTSELGAIQHGAYEALARNCLENGKDKALGEIVNASYMSPIGRTKALVVAPGLLRLYLQHLITRGEWKTVRREAMRAMYHAGSTSSWEDRYVLAFTKWALSEARANLVDPADPKAGESPATWRHPLVVNDDREMLNTLGEFMFLIKSKHYEPACKVITLKTIPDALVSLGDEEDLLQSSHFRVREVIRKTPELRAVLNRDYAEIGMIRLERARRQNDLSALKSLAVQFYGTAPGFGAMHVLADRDLSNGNFWGAAGRYKLLAAEEDYDKQSDAAAKLRLASAMLGRLVGKPADKPVALPGGTFSAKEFEQMITRLAADRKTAPLTSAANKVHLAPEPRGRTAKLTYLTTISGERVSSSQSTTAKSAVFTVGSERLIISFIDKLLAIDTKTRKVSWFHEPDRQQRSGRKRNRRGKSLISLAARPLRVGDKLFVRYGLKGRPLTCIDTKTGKFLWSRQYDDYVLSDPILLGSWVSVITADQDTSLGLQLHRVSPETGESSLSSGLVRIRDIWPAIGRPVVVGDAVVFRAEGCLVNCNLRGTVRWAKRIPFVPPEVSPGLHSDTPLDDMIVRNENVIFSLPGCPYIMCISSQSGEVLWSFMRQPSAHILGLHAGGLIVVESNRICALDPDTGKVRWRRKHTAGLAAVLSAAKDTLISVHMIKAGKPTGKNRQTPSSGRFVQWISAKDGRTVKEIPIEGDQSIHHAMQITSDGKHVFGLSNYEPNKLPKVFMIELAN
ncbi:MAG: PQQ-binding-like beta-propeller repeat protein [Phycisphaerae bacterium]|jgi:outer membrane protein assembly factor BamB|nr:PQQ-binding-like beta-propeller repeat protein [Phycisphaerae bacterium]